MVATVLTARPARRPQRRAGHRRRWTAWQRAESILALVTAAVLLAAALTALVAPVREPPAAWQSSWPSR